MGIFLEFLLRITGNQYEEPNGLLDKFSNFFIKNKIFNVDTPELRPEIVEINKDLVIFKDQSKFSAEIIIWATGYSYYFPFLSDEVIKIENNPSRVFLYKHVFLHNFINIAFIGNFNIFLSFNKWEGLPTVYGSLHPVCEVQSKWFARIIAGKCSLPGKQEMETEIEKHRDMLNQYNVKYRPLQISTNHYIDDLQKLMRL